MAPLADSSRLADLEHPWLGLESFREETRAYFFGRDVEITEIDLRLRSHPLLVLYGRSGLGKTSILSAGLIPRLTRAGHRPAIYRFNYSNNPGFRLGPAWQLLLLLFISPESEDEPPLPKVTAPSKITAKANGTWWANLLKATRPYLSAASSFGQWATELREKLGFDLPLDSASLLWLRLHWSRQPPTTTHLILDQFEEVFTLGAQQPGAEHELRDALAILLQGMIPASISQLIAKYDSFLDHFDTDSTPVRVVLALRDDYVYALNRWKSHIASLGQNNFELRALRGPAAYDAVFKPGELRCRYQGDVNERNKIGTGLPPIVSQETAERIIRFIAKKSPDVPLEEIEAVPPILSLLCRELNERRFTQPGGAPKMPAQQMTFSESDADVETIIKTFYERCLAGQPEAVRIFIEEELVSNSGARLAQDEKSILSCFEQGWGIPGAPDGRRAAGFGDAAKARECLKDLVNQRLLTPFGGGENPSYELIHDLVASVAEKNRTGRQERFEKEQAERRAEAEMKAKDEAKARAQIERERAAALDVALDTAQKAKIEADNLRKRTDSLVGLITFVEKELTAALESIGKTSLATEFKKRLAEYRRQYADVLPKIGSWEDQLKDVRSRGNRLKDTGDLSGALQLYLQGIDLTQKQLGRGTDGSQAQMWLARFMRDQGDVLMAQGNLQQANQRFQEALEIDQRLAQTKPDNSDWQRDLSVSYARVSDVQSAQGDRASALKSYRDSLAIREKLAKQDPGNAGWQRDLSISYTKVGDVLSAQGDLASALKSYRDSFAIFEKLAQEDPGDARCQRDLSISYERIGDVLSAQGDLAGALKSYRDSLAIREKLAKQDPGNARWQRNLSVSYNKVGDVLSAQGDLAGALKSYRDGLAISEKLAKLDPGNAGWQRDLSISYTKVGDVQSAQKDVAGALKSYRDDLAISEKLAKQDPSNAEWQADMAFSYWQNGATLARAASPISNVQARDMIEKGRDILRQLKERTGLTVRQQQWLDRCEADLGAIQEASRKAEFPRER